MKNYRSRILIAGLLSIFLFIQYKLWFGSQGMREMMQLKKALATQVAENDKLKERNQALLFQMGGQQNSKDAVESRARNELGMIKEDEKFYQIVK